MGWFRECAGGGSKGLCKGLLVVPLVIFCILFTAKTVEAPSAAAPLVANVSQSVSSAVQELLTEVVVFLQETARALNRIDKIVMLLSKTWSWMKISLFAIGGTVGLAIWTALTAVVTLFLADFGRNKWGYWKSLMPTTLEDVLTKMVNLENKVVNLEREAVNNKCALEGANKTGNLDESLDKSEPYNKGNPDYGVPPPVSGSQ